MAQIYDKPTKQLMKEFVDQNLRQGEIFEKKGAVDWFAKHYPNIKPGTVQMHVEGMAINSGARKHHPSIKANSGHNLFYKVSPGRFRLWEEAKDPERPIYREQTTAEFIDGGTDDEERGTDQEESYRASQEFAF